MAEQPAVAVRLISPGYLRTLRIALRRGRDFTAADALDRPAVVLISEAMARRFWPGEDPLGKRLILGLAPRVSQEVVGAVADVREDGLRVAAPVATVYQPMAQRPWPATTFVVRAKTRPESLVQRGAPGVTRLRSRSCSKSVQRPPSRVESLSAYQERSRSHLQT
jgi:hypothetical protein